MDKRNVKCAGKKVVVYLYRGMYGVGKEETDNKTSTKEKKDSHAKKSQGLAVARLCPFPFLSRLVSLVPFSFLLAPPSSEEKDATNIHTLSLFLGSLYIATSVYTAIILAHIHINI